MKTSKNLKQLSIIDELTSSQGASPASPSPMQGKEKAHKMTVTSGLRCLESYERFPQHSLWVKMFVASLIGVAQMENPIWYSTKCALIWKLRATKSHRLYFQLAAKTHPTDEIASGLLPTPNAYDWNTARMPETYNAYRKKKEQEGVHLQMTLKQIAYNGLLPTPCAQADDKITGLQNQGSMNKRTRFPTGKPSLLSPLFVEEMMGFPKGWTASPFQSGEERP